MMHAAARAVLSIAGGFLLGACFFSLLRVTVRLYESRRWARAIAVHLARWALLVTALVTAARAGALPLLAATGGALLARALLLRGAKEGTP